MKHEAFALFGLLISLNALADQNLPHPTWMNADIAEIEQPINLSGAEQEQCTQVILEEMSKRTKLSFTADNVVPIQFPGWNQAEKGFVRGGGFNIHVVATISETRKKLHHFHAGRFANFLTWLRMGDEPSLHLPDNIDGLQTYFETEDESGTHVDVVAHVDSAYAYLPIGLFVHLFTDVVGADTRNPCPIKGGESKED
jgi:hypothetical protein